MRLRARVFLLLWRSSAVLRAMGFLSILGVTLVVMLWLTAMHAGWIDAVFGNSSLTIGDHLTALVLVFFVVAAYMLWTVHQRHQPPSLRLMFWWLPGALGLLVGVVPIVVGGAISRSDTHSDVFEIASLASLGVTVLVWFATAGWYWVVRRSLKKRVIGTWGLVCPACAYDLGGRTDEGRCPECGKYYDTGRIMMAWGHWLHGP